MSNKKAQPAYKHPESSGQARGRAELLPLAKRVTEASGTPVVGGVAVVLHGGPTSTSDIDIYSDDFWQTHTRLEAAGIMWNAERREHMIDGVAIHMVGSDSLGGEPKRISTIDGVKVIGLADLIRGKLTVGLEEIRRGKDVAHVIDLIRVIPLGKDFAAKLPKHLRAPFKQLVDDVHGTRRTSTSVFQYYKKYSPNPATRRTADQIDRSRQPAA